MQVARAIFGRSVLRTRARYCASTVFARLLIPAPDDVFVAEAAQSSKLKVQSGK
jgi:hypothetical protein